MLKQCNDCRGIREIRVGAICSECKLLSTRRTMARVNMGRGRRLTHRQREALTAKDGKERDEFGNDVNGDDIADEKVW